jgi:hypothetical protein
VFRFAGNQLVVAGLVFDVEAHGEFEDLVVTRQGGGDDVGVVGL